MNINEISKNINKGFNFDDDIFSNALEIIQDKIDNNPLEVEVVSFKSVPAVKYPIENAHPDESVINFDFVENLNLEIDLIDLKIKENDIENFKNFLEKEKPEFCFYINGYEVDINPSTLIINNNKLLIDINIKDLDNDTLDRLDNDFSFNNYDFSDR